MDMDKYIGRLLDGRYEILEVIGVGGMAVVYKARCHRLNRLVAIKILKDDYFQDEEFRRRFHAESQAVAMLSHPNIVSVYDVSTSNDADYIVMELIDGITLKQYMEKKGVLNWKETLHFAIQIGKALDHAHSRGIVHRDIKPHNVMVLKNGSVKVADFGIARVMSKSNTLTKEALGSVHYISPEQAKGGRVDNRSDIYSLGVVMYEMMTGRPPFDGESPVAVAIQHINGNAAMPSTLNPNIPGGLEQIIMKAMSREPGKRYATEAAMLYDMDEFRKNPAILFDYNNPATEMDAATRLSEVGSRREEETMVLPKTAAQKAAAKAEPAKVPQEQRPQRSTKPTRRRREEEIVEEDDHTGRIATVAIVLCALVALVAIGVFVYAMLNGGLGTQDEVIQVPSLIGMTQSELQDLEFIIRVGEKDYHETFPAGQIYDQNPKAGDMIPKGSPVTIYVSLGKAPEKKVMEDLVTKDLEEETAKKYLVDVLEIAEKNIVVHYESSAAKPVGTVTRTNPAKGEELKDDQTVELWISTGPIFLSGRVPNVVGQSRDDAQKLLNANGFKEIHFEEVESNQDKGTVVEQSEKAQTEVDVNTPIILKISLGPQKPDDPVDDPIVDPDLVDKIVTVALPEEMLEPYTVSIWLDGKMLQLRQIPVGTLSTQFRVTGKGMMEFEVRLNESPDNSWTIEVDFDE